MSESSLIAGLDAGSSKVCCIAAELEKDGTLRILSVGTAPSVGIRRGIVQDLDAASQCIREAVSRAAGQIGIPIEAVYASVSGEHLQTMNTRGVASVTTPDKQIRPEDRDRALEQSKLVMVPPEREILHAIPRKYIVDGADDVKQPVGMFGSRLEVETHIITGISTLLKNFRKAIEQADLVLEQCVFAGLAAASAVLSEEEKESGVCLIDIGGGTTDVAAFTRGEIYWARVLSLGGDHVTNDLAQLLPASLSEAERLKVEHGHCVLSRIDPDEPVDVLLLGNTSPRPLRRGAICTIIAARMEEIFSIIAKDLKKLQDEVPLAAGVVITGGAAQLQGVAECAAAVLELPVVVRGPTGIGPFVTGFSNAGACSAGMDSPAFAAAVGLVRRAAHEIRQYQADSEEGFLETIKTWLGRLWRRR